MQRELKPDFGVSKGEGSAFEGWIFTEWRDKKKADPEAFLPDRPEFSTQPGLS